MATSSRNGHIRKLTALEGLLQEFPQDAKFQGDLAMIQGNRGWLLTQQKRWKDARPELEKAVALAELALKPNPADPTARETLRGAYRDLTNACLNLGDHVEAAHHAHRFADAYKKTREDYYLAAANVARCIPLARKDATLNEKDRDSTAQRYGEQCLELLRQAIAKGYANAKQIGGNTAFDPLRSHAEFQRLVKLLGPP